MTLTYNESGQPILKTEKDDVQVVISFADVSAKENLKQTMLDLLTMAYEKRIQTN